MKTDSLTTETRVGKLIGSCGHECQETVDVAYHSEDCDAVLGWAPCIVYVSFCPQCAANAATWPEFIKPEDRATAKPGVRS